MTYHGVAFRAASAACCFEHPNCPRCGDTLLLPEAAEFAGAGCIRHTWVCDSCGHAFQTAVALPECSENTQI
jgi:transposase-like protein